MLGRKILHENRLYDSRNICKKPHMFGENFTIQPTRAKNRLIQIEIISETVLARMLRIVNFMEAAKKVLITIIIISHLLNLI